MQQKENYLSKNFEEKIKNFILQNEYNIKNLNILEFGVRQGRSTEMFLEMCKNNNGKLISVDIDDYSNLFLDKNWTFIKSRDDDYEKVSKFFTNKFDIILIDSFHEPTHVKNLIFTYWDHLKINGSMYIDDISWLPYVKNGWRDHKYTEIINKDTFFKILEVQLSNFNNIDLSFSFNGSGMCRMKKKNDNKLKIGEKLISRKYIFRNILKKIFYFFK